MRLTNGRDGLIAACSILVEHKYVSAEFCEAQRDSASDARGSAGNYSDFAFEGKQLAGSVSNFLSSHVVLHEENLARYTTASRALSIAANVLWTSLSVCATVTMEWSAAIGLM